MAVRKFFQGSSLAHHVGAVRNAPREMIFNRTLLLSMHTICHFDFDSGNSALANRNSVSIVWVGAGVGGGASFFLNDILGRRWSFRLYAAIWILGQVVATSLPTLSGLYVSRIISGLGIGALTVIGPMSIAEIAPSEIRGTLTAWFNVAINMGGTAGAFCVYGVFQNMTGTSLQYRVVWFTPAIFMFLCIVTSFFISESPRWLLLLRGLSLENPRVHLELQEMKTAIQEEQAMNAEGMSGILRGASTIPSSLRRVQQSLVTYGLTQLSGANSVTSYFVPILTFIGIGGDSGRNIFLKCMYSFSKFCFAIIASLFFVDALGRRKSLFVEGADIAHSASTGAIAFIFIHGFGYVVGLYILPYFGSALSQCFHWLFLFAMAYGTPSLLHRPTIGTSGLSVEAMDKVFEGPWFNAARRAHRSPPAHVGVEVDGESGKVVR
ncbi:hypothetical protein BDV09DRAFT_206298 [Aspergillus tetrazonus]